MKFRDFDSHQMSCKHMAHKYLKKLARDANYVCRPNYKLKASVNAVNARYRIQAWKMKAEQLYVLESEQANSDIVRAPSQSQGLEYTMDYERARAFYFTEYADNCGYFNELFARELIVVGQRNADCRVDYTVVNYRKMWRRNEDIKSHYADNSSGKHTTTILSPDWPASAY